MSVRPKSEIRMTSSPKLQVIIEKICDAKVCNRLIHFFQALVSLTARTKRAV
jgi:hypothetical protein